MALSGPGRLVEWSAELGMQRDNDRAVMFEKARAEFVAERDAVRDYFKESVDALKEAAEAHRKFKKSPQDDALLVPAARGWVKAQQCVLAAMLADNVTEKVKSALRTKQPAIENKLKDLASTLGPEQMGSLIPAYEEEKAREVELGLKPTTDKWDEARNAAGLPPHCRGQDRIVPILYDLTLYDLSC